jgi:multicomponent Na+:H+ antiporter subunit E
VIGVRIEGFNWKTLPVQVFWLVVYIVQLSWSILLSSVDVARRVLDPRLPIQPGEIIVPTQDSHPLIGALSAHAITAAPGEMVIDLNEHEMIVHTLDVEATRGRIDAEQTNRMQLLRRIMGGKKS